MPPSPRGLPARKDWHPDRAEACAPLSPGDRPRDVESGPLHRAVRLHRSAFVAAARHRGYVVPRVVERELDGVVGCGVLARVRCGACGHELLVPLSCERRGLCPSGTACHAEDTAAHLVDRVLPRAPHRQWVFTFPIAVRLVGFQLGRRPESGSGSRSSPALQVRWCPRRRRRLPGCRARRS
jgi:hypothetical protein